MKFDAQYQETVLGKDGTSFDLRLVRAEDKDLFVEGLSRCSPLTLYNRFLSPKPKFSAAELKYLTECHPKNHVAIIALHEGLLAGVARAVRYVDHPDSADFGMIVSDEFQGIGLGRILLDRLFRASKEHGVDYFEGEMFATNHHMFNLIDTMPVQTEWLLAGQTVSMVIDLASYVPKA